MGAVPIGLMITKQTAKAVRKFSITSFNCVGADASSVDKNAPSEFLQRSRYGLDDDTPKVLNGDRNAKLTVALQVGPVFGGVAQLVRAAES